MGFVEHQKYMVCYLRHFHLVYPPKNSIAQLDKNAIQAEILDKSLLIKQIPIHILNLELLGVFLTASGLVLCIRIPDGKHIILQNPEERLQPMDAKELHQKIRSARIATQRCLNQKFALEVKLSHQK